MYWEIIYMFMCHCGKKMEEFGSGRIEKRRSPKTTPFLSSNNLLFYFLTIFLINTPSSQMISKK